MLQSNWFDYYVFLWMEIITSCLNTFHFYTKETILNERKIVAELNIEYQLWKLIWVSILYSANWWENDCMFKINKSLDIKSDLFDVVNNIGQITLIKLCLLSRVIIMITTIMVISTYSTLYSRRCEKTCLQDFLVILKRMLQND